MRQTLLIVILALAACTDKPKTPISIVQKTFVYPIVIFPLGDEVIDQTFITRKALEFIPDFLNYDSLPEEITSDAYTLIFATEKDPIFISPEIISAADDFKSLEQEDINAFLTANRNIHLMFFAKTDDIVKKQIAIGKFISAITSGKKALITDYSSIQTFNANTWQKARVESLEAETPNINDHIVFHSYREEEFCRIVSMGMIKFGLPEFSITNTSCSYNDAYLSLMNAVSQTLFETQQIYSDSTIQVDLNKIKNKIVRESALEASQGAPGVTELKLKSVAPREGDNPYAQVLIVFDDPSYTSEQEQQTAILSQLFAYAEDKAVETDHDALLIEASEKARQRLPALKNLFNQGLAPGVSLLVKSPFARTDVVGNEWMWVEVTKWTNEEMEGTLQNDANYIEDLRVGKPVKIKEGEIFDYLLINADGTEEGNETGKIIERQMGGH